MTEIGDPASPEAAALLDRLSEDLRLHYGSDGRASFTDWDAADPKHLFVIFRRNGDAIGCGAIRPISSDVGEVKRMYSLEPGQGTGRAVLSRLCEEAAACGYRHLWLETRRANGRAVGFYERFGFTRRENYGGYVGRDECVCFELELSPAPVEVGTASLDSDDQRA